MSWTLDQLIENAAGTNPPAPNSNGGIPFVAPAPFTPTSGATPSPVGTIGEDSGRRRPVRPWRR